MPVRVKDDKLFFDFRWRGVRCREFTALETTPENRRRCQALDAIIQGEIALDTFDYRRHFPNGSKLRAFYPERTTERITVASYLRTWHARRSPFRPDGTVIDGAELHPSTWMHDESVLAGRLIPRLGSLYLPTDAGYRADALSPGRCRDYRKELQDGGLTGKTVCNILGVLHKAMQDAVEEGLMPVNPVPRLSRWSRRAQVDRTDARPLALDEVERFLAAVEGPYRDLYLVWFRTGWRPSEILALRFDWLDVTHQVASLRRGRIPRWGGVEAAPKTGPRDVHCAYDPAIFAAFERRRRASVATGQRDYVFTDAAGKPLSQEWLHKRLWLSTLRRAGIPARGQYNIRDTFITLALSAGEDPGWVAQVCGTSEQMIFRHYRRWIPSQVRPDGRRIAALYRRPAGRRTDPAWAPDGHRRPRVTRKSVISQEVTSGGGGNRTPVRR